MQQALRLRAARSCGLSSSAHSAGLRVSETKQEITVEAAIVTANWRKNWPEMPVMKAEGTNTAHSASAIAISAPPTSSMVRCAASRGVMPGAQVALDVLHHDDRVVDDDADRQHQAEQRQIVEREAERREHGEGADQRHRDRDDRDDRGAPGLQEHDHDDDDQHDRLEDRLDHLVDRLAR